MTTIREIADIAGDSIGTVDRVIHNRGGISRKTEELIKKVIEELNKGIIDFLIGQQSENQGYLGTNLLYRKVVLNEEVQKENLMPIDIIVKENLQFYQIR